MSHADDPKEPAALSRRLFLQGFGAVAAATAALPGESSAQTLEVEPAAPTEEPPPKRYGPGDVEIALHINGKERKLKVEPRVTLLNALRDRLDITGAKKVCDRGTCGACSVIIDGALRYSCMTLAVECVGAKIETIEGLAPEGEASDVSKAFAHCDALQCGFCTPGFVMTITHHLREEKHPTVETARRACQGNLCRCGTYNRVFEAAVLAATGGAGLPSAPQGGK